MGRGVGSLGFVGRLRARLRRSAALIHRPVREWTAARNHLCLIDDLSSDFISRNLTCRFVGGYALDALRGKLSRAHKDLDLSVLSRDIPAVLSVLRNRGFTTISKAPYVWHAKLGDVGIDVFCWHPIGGGMIETIAACNIGVRIPENFLTNARLVNLKAISFLAPSSEYMASVLPLTQNPADRSFTQTLPLCSEVNFRRRCELVNGVETTIFEYIHADDSAGAIESNSIGRP